MYANEIYDVVKKHQIPLEKVCFLQLPTVFAVDPESNLNLAKKLLGEENYEIVDSYMNDGQARFIQRDLETYTALNTRESFRYIEEKRLFCGRDKYAEAGCVNTYFFQDLWAARLVGRHRPTNHFDIGSRIDGFIGHLLSFLDKVTLIDIRPLEIPIPGVEFVQADAMNLNTIPDGSIESLSALCSLEHFGLGRYGDPIDPEGCFKAFDAIQRKIKPGGFAYISVPVGWEHLEFNAHRIFYAKTIAGSFDKMNLVEYSITDGKSIQYNVPLDACDECRNGAEIFGLFCFQKPVG